MSPLIKAILNGDIQALRRSTRENPDLLDIPSDVGTLPFRLALDKGRTDVQVALKRADAAGSEGLQDYSELLIGYIQAISQSHTCASWLDGIEFILWQLISTDQNLKDDLVGLQRLDEPTRADLRFLSSQCAGWAMYLDNGPRFVPMKEWLSAVDHWQRAHV